MFLLYSPQKKHAACLWGARAAHGTQLLPHTLWVPATNGHAVHNLPLPTLDALCYDFGYALSPLGCAQQHLNTSPSLHQQPARSGLAPLAAKRSCCEFPPCNSPCCSLRQHWQSSPSTATAGRTVRGTWRPFSTVSAQTTPQLRSPLRWHLTAPIPPWHPCPVPPEHCPTFVHRCAPRQPPPPTRRPPFGADLVRAAVRQGETMCCALWP